MYRAALFTPVFQKRARSFVHVRFIGSSLLEEPPRIFVLGPGLRTTQAFPPLTICPTLTKFQLLFGALCLFVVESTAREPF